MKVDKKTVDGISLEEMLRRMDAAGIDRAVLVASKFGRGGQPSTFHIP